MTLLLVGLGNVGKQYSNTRHNAGFWFVEQFAQKYNISLTTDKKFHALVGHQKINGVDVRLCLPTTLMNLSGKAVAPMMQFYQVAPDALIVAHDELDIACGMIKLKTDGGHGGHNGLRDIIPHTGTAFHRLRIGIGRPTHGNVESFVLSAPTSDERLSIDNAINHALQHSDLLLAGDYEKARSYINAHK